ncbi:MAG: alpha-amylase family glycosyl hydrolase, partial [Firmicutes bacterium]|nr:alpha-amylase family glycosyl hydrolase [Bacillota bacterium]
DLLWISPLYASPNYDNGSDISDYYAIHPDFGTMADFDCMVAEADRRGIGLIMDMVINHTSTDHPWFQKSIQGEEPYKDFYIWRPGKGGRSPTNGRAFSGATPGFFFSTPFIHSHAGELHKWRQ